MSDLVHDTVVDLLSRGMGVRFRARGDSMYPSIRSGDYLHVSPVKASALICGDVVLSLTRRGLTAHRLVAIDHLGFTTRGDNALGIDAPFSADQLVGRVDRVERDGRMRPVRGSTTATWIRLLRRLRHSMRRARGVRQE